MTTDPKLSRREREIMDLVYELASVTVRDLTDRLRDPPTDGAVRTMLARLEDKGLLRKVGQDGRTTWAPTAPRSRVQRTAVRRLLRTFFDGSVEQAVSALLANPRELGDEQLERLARLIEEHRRRAR
jgi:predicted transcriptional regulator